MAPLNLAVSTPMDLATSALCHTIVKFLLDRRASTDLKDKDGVRNKIINEIILASYIHILTYDTSIY